MQKHKFFTHQIFLYTSATAVLLFFSVAFFSIQGRQDTSPSFEIDDMNVREEVNVLMQAGRLDAAANLVKAAERKGVITNDDCHSLMHLVGHEAYFYFGNDFAKMIAASEGEECIGGYIHGIEAQITLSSNNPINDLQDFCHFLDEKGMKTRTCYHGAGHASMELTRHDIRRSLVFCDALAGGPEKDLGDCYRGVFSEVGNLALGVDGHTGLSIQPVVFEGLNFDSPHLFCDLFAKQYQTSCYSQMAKLFYSGDIDTSFLRCVQEKYNDTIQKICVTILSGMYARAVLSSQEYIVMPKVVYTLPEDLQMASILGAKDAFVGYAINGEFKDWQPLCDSYSSDKSKNYCVGIFHILE